MNQHAHDPQNGHLAAHGYVQPGQHAGGHDAAAMPAGAVPLPPDPQHPHGNWVVLRDHTTMDGGDVVDILSTIGGQTAGENAARMRMAILGKLVTNWSFEHLPTPPSEQVLRMLPAPALLALFALIRPAFELINGTSVKPVMSRATIGDEASPTPGSSE